MLQLKQNNPVTIKRDEANGVILTGYAAVFNRESKLLNEGKGIFRELIKPSAFDKVLKRVDLDYILTVNHDKDKLLARSKSGTLNLSIDEVGLKFTASMPNTTLGKDTIEQIERGDLAECSFIASVPTNKIKRGKGKDGVMRHIVEEVSDLRDVSIVARGAYGDKASLSELVKRSVDIITGQVTAQKAIPLREELKREYCRLSKKHETNGVLTMTEIKRKYELEDMLKGV
jgi:HK97 family phage prohead protease